jgi:hypothetical protein
MVWSFKVIVFEKEKYDQISVYWNVVSDSSVSKCHTSVQVIQCWCNLFNSFQMYRIIIFSCFFWDFLEEDVMQHQSRVVIVYELHSDLVLY